MKCGYKDCGKEATHRYRWPKQPEEFVCYKHSTMVQMSSSILGVDIGLDRIPKVTDDKQTLHGPTS